ncbi:hypothetical protein B5807_05350 [Epicoccum nigrum]|jgi:hypothetical protein|uniref:Uncharacterized protein n=1 Tax=Epicoccum nigrum TaxID=105696 RepID=A0A1Y2LZA6_EPING|nr:hypothetical protein B5807_05350 [Epicoccum nigrum]
MLSNPWSGYYGRTQRSFYQTSHLHHEINVPLLNERGSSQIRLVEKEDTFLYCPGLQQPIYISGPLMHSILKVTIERNIPTLSNLSMALMPAESSKSSLPGNNADLNAVIGLSAIIFLFLLALGYICSNQRKRRERDVEQQQSGREACTSHPIRVAGVGTLWNSTDMSSSPGLSRADSATSSLSVSEDNVKRDWLWSRKSSQPRTGRSEKDVTLLKTLERATDSRSLVRAWEQQTVETSPPLYSNHRRQDSVHSVAGKIVVQQLPLLRIPRGRRCCSGAGTRGGSAARKHHSTLATILEPEAALQAASADQSCMHDCEEAVRD